MQALPQRSMGSLNNMSCRKKSVHQQDLAPTMQIKDNKICVIDGRWLCGPFPLCPSTDYLERGEDPVVRNIVRRHETLSATIQNLIKNLVILSDDYQKSQHMTSKPCYGNTIPQKS